MCFVIIKENTLNAFLDQKLCLRKFFKVNIEPKLSFKLFLFKF